MNTNIIYKKTNGKHFKIAMLGHKRVPSREGGIEVVVEELSSRMAARGYDVTCYNRQGQHVSGKEFNTNFQNLKKYKGINLKSVFTINMKGIAAMTASVTGAFCVTFRRYNVIHFHAEGPCAMLWLPKFFGKRCVVTVHGLDHQRAKWGKLARAYIMLGERVAARFADEIIVLSENVQKYFLQTYNRKTRFIPNGVNRPEIKDSKLISERWNLSKDSYILYLGRLVPEKGLQYLIQSFKEVDTEKKLVIAGGSSDSDNFVNELKQMSKECVDKIGDTKVLFTGFVQGDILAELYSNAYVYVLPSDLEGMPLSLLESMSYGNCCLVSDIEECKSVITDENGMLKGVVFKQSNVESLKEKLQILCDDEQLVRKYKDEAAGYICKKYNWDDVVNQTLELYEGNSCRGISR